MTSVKHGGGKVMVRGCFGGAKMGYLFLIKAILNKEGDRSVLQSMPYPVDGV